MTAGKSLLLICAGLLFSVLPTEALEWQNFEDESVGIAIRLPQQWSIRAGGSIPRTYSIQPDDSTEDMIIFQLMPRDILFSGPVGIEDVEKLLVQPDEAGFLSARTVRIAGTPAVYARYAFSSADGGSFRKDFIHFLYRDYVVSCGFIVETSRYSLYLPTMMEILETLRFNDVSAWSPLIAGFS